MRALALTALALVACSPDRTLAPPARVRARVVDEEGTPSIRISFDLSQDDGRGLKIVREYQVLRAHSTDGPFEPFAHGEIVTIKSGRGKKAKPTRHRTVDDTSALPGVRYHYQVWALAEREVGGPSAAGARSAAAKAGPVTLPGRAIGPAVAPEAAPDVSVGAPDDDDGRHVDVSFAISPDDDGGRRLEIERYVVLRAEKAAGPFQPIVYDRDRAKPGAPEPPLDPVASQLRVQYLVGLLGDNAEIDPADRQAFRDLIESGDLPDVEPRQRPERAAAALGGLILEELAGSSPPDPTAARKRRVRDTVAGKGPYFYRVYVVPGRGDAVASETTPAVRPKTAWFSTSKTSLAVVLLAVFALMLGFLKRAQSAGQTMFVRRIAGIDALEEAVGRATEMGRPILYVPGIDEIQNIQTIASILILGRVAELVARYDSQIRVPCCIPIVATIAEEVVRQGYYNAGRPDQHRPQNIQWISAEQFAFCAGTNSIMLRDKPATNIFLGRFFAESLILAETGYVNKAIQVGGTAEITQLPFFIAACDYAIIGEELFAISAYMAREPKLLGSIKAADWIKVGILVAATLATVGGVFAWLAAPLSGTTAKLAGLALDLVRFWIPGT